MFEKVPAGHSAQLELPAIFNPVMFMRELAMLITVGMQVEERNEAVSWSIRQGRDKKQVAKFSLMKLGCATSLRVNHLIFIRENEVE